ncbi:hypothetical protein TWF718_009524 [Orbilia javanica]|uniref:Uncharacterized protein n=1 Tax=Orbilia javanica TaxID=47235 RepID=A0AAN8MVP6_9PEZI
MPSYSSILLCSVLALGASASDYGYAPVSISTASIPTTIAASVASADVLYTAPPLSVTSSAPAQPTATAAACPLKFEKGCAFICSGPKFSPSCETEWSYSTDSSCTPCPGIQEECPAIPEPSCAYLCKAEGAAASKGEAETPFCWDNDMTKKGEMTCSPCGAASGFNVTSVTPASPYTVYTHDHKNSTVNFSTHDHKNSTVTLSTHEHKNGTATVSTHHGGNGTTYAPPPIYTSGASALTIGGSAIVGLALAFFAL